MQKCLILGINCEQEKINRWANLVGCDVGSFPSSYFSLPFSVNPGAILFWDPPWKRLERDWLVGRKVFPRKSGEWRLSNRCWVVSHHYFSLFKAPILVCKSIEKIMRDFLWKGVEEGKGSHLVSWEVVGNLWIKGGWSSKIHGYATKPYWLNGCWKIYFFYLISIW